MGYFKTKSKSYILKKRLRFFEMILIIIFLAFISSKYKINQEKLKKITLSYLGFNYSIKENSVPSEENIKEEVVLQKTDPLIYIYNTHQTEKYQYEKIADYNIDYNVFFASQILASYLGDKAIVEKTNINDVLKENNFHYYESYKASRILMEKQKQENPSIEYYIDLHRDSSSYDHTTCDINGIKYAKIMFVVGLEHENYEKNLEFAKNLNEAIKKINECFSRGVLQKQGQGVNGIYNQDFSEKVILIEVGGQYNTIEEVNNILEIFAQVYSEYIGVNYE